MIGIIAAMAQEINALKNLMTEVEETKHQNIEFFIGKLDDQCVVLCKSGIGKVYSTIATTILIQNYHPTFIINIGSAGSLNLNIRVGSVVIPPIVAHHDCQVPGWPTGFEGSKRAYHADEKLLELAKDLKDEHTYFVPLVSGDSFICQSSQTKTILERFPEAGCCEMEGASIAQTASFFDVPFIVIRSISDVTLEDGNEVDFDAFLKVAAVNSANYCRNFVKEAHAHAVV